MFTLMFTKAVRRNYLISAAASRYPAGNNTMTASNTRITSATTTTTPAPAPVITTTTTTPAAVITTTTTTPAPVITTTTTTPAPVITTTTTTPAPVITTTTTSAMTTTTTTPAITTTTANTKTTTTPAIRTTTANTTTTIANTMTPAIRTTTANTMTPPPFPPLFSIFRCRCDVPTPVFESYFMCRICEPEKDIQNTITSLQDVIDHHKKEHDEIVKKECKHCGYPYIEGGNLWKFNEHINHECPVLREMNMLKLTLDCNICGHHAESLKDLDKHVRREHWDLRDRCDDCKNAFISPKALWEHYPCPWAEFFKKQAERSRRDREKRRHHKSHGGH